MRKNYLIMLGAPKCGTTSLSSWLGEQPYAALAKQKETLYFTDFSDRNWSGPGADFADNRPLTPEAFNAEFDENPEAELRIEASTDNLSCVDAAENIARFLERGDVGRFWLLAILRDPIDRIVSEYEHTLRLGWQKGSLLKSLKLEDRRVKEGYNPLFWHIERSRYYEQVSRYKELFGDHLMIIDYSKINEESERNKILDWMGYSDKFFGDLQHSNKRSVLARPATVGFLKSERILNLGRALFPKTVRPMVRRLITGGEVGRYEVGAREIDFIRDALSDDMKACVDSHLIPTENWGSSLSR